jgi:hypothetical protein
MDIFWTFDTAVTLKIVRGAKAKEGVVSLNPEQC